MSLRLLQSRLGKIENTANSATTYPADMREWTDEQLIAYAGKEWAVKLEWIMMEKFGVEYNHSDPRVFTDEQLEIIVKL